MKKLKNSIAFINPPKVFELKEVSVTNGFICSLSSDGILKSDKLFKELKGWDLIGILSENKDDEILSAAKKLKLDGNLHWAIFVNNKLKPGQPKKPDAKQPINLRLHPDVIHIIRSKPNQVAYIEALVLKNG